MRIDSGFVEPFDFAAVGARQPTSRARVLEVRIQSPQRSVNELSVPLDEGVFEPPDLLQTRMNGCDQIVVEADQILRRPRAMSRPRARATEAKR